MAVSDDVPTIDDKLIQKTAADFATFLNFTSESQVESIEESIEDVLTRLDELFGMLDMIRSDNALASDELLCQVRSQIEKLKPVFERIDQLEEFVGTIKNSVTIMEKEVKSIEEEFSTLTSIKKAFHGFSFLGLKKKSSVSSTPRMSKESYSPPSIFATKDWIDSSKNSCDS